MKTAEMKGSKCNSENKGRRVKRVWSLVLGVYIQEVYSFFNLRMGSVNLTIAIKNRGFLNERNFNFPFADVRTKRKVFR
jgi:hypothetical protein